MMVGPALLRCENCEGDRHDDCVRTEEGCACYANNSRHLAERAKVAMLARKFDLLDYVSVGHSNRCKGLPGSYGPHRDFSCEEAHPCDCNLTRARELIRLRLLGQKVGLGDLG